MQSKQWLAKPPSNIPRNTLEALQVLHDRIVKKQSESDEPSSMIITKPTIPVATYSVKRRASGVTVPAGVKSAKKPCTDADPLAFGSTDQPNSKRNSMPQLELLKNAVTIASAKNDTPSNGMASDDVITIDD